MKPDYETYEFENYRIVPNNESGCFNIYNKQGERTGAFDYSDIKVRQGRHPFCQPFLEQIAGYYMFPDFTAN